MNTLLQAVKAIAGGITALKGQLIKGSGYLVSASGKVCFCIKITNYNIMLIMFQCFFKGYCKWWGISFKCWKKYYRISSFD